MEQHLDMFKSFKFWRNFVGGYLAVVAGIWGLVEAYTYFQGTQLKELLGNLWLMFYGFPIPVAFVLAYLTIIDRKARLERQRQDIARQATPQRIQEWLVNYYTSKGQSHYLYEMNTTPTTLAIPFLTKTEWVLSERMPDSLVVFPPEPTISLVKPDPKFIDQRRQLFGQEVWDDPIYCATRLTTSDIGIRVEAGYGNYFQFLTACGPLSDEVLFAVAYNRATHYRNKMTPTLDMIETFPCKAHAIGIHSLVIGKGSDGEFTTVLHRRSRKVAINTGTFTGVPTFTFQPHSGSDKHDQDITHSFLREYLEELYDKEEFIKSEADKSRPRVTWWYGLPEMRPVIEMMKQGEANFQMLGLGFDPSYCDLVICVCLIIYNQPYWEKALGEMRKNWEASQRVFRQEYPLFSKEVDELLTKRLIQPGTAYCIDRARMLLKA
ncbi:MAG: hypothetical protein M5U01_00370 [Ardenticatenaceae bacterium]|nr:hypothetical protein [Ardenticatenaceae bacterium]